MSAELIGNSVKAISPTPRELAATLFRRPRLVAASFGFALLATMLLVVFSARYESHFKVLLRRGRFDPVASSQPPSAMDFTRPDITEEELNSEVELLRDEDLLKQVVKRAGLVPANVPDVDRPAETEHAVRKLARRLDVDALKKSNLIQVSYKDTDPERAARILAALSTLYVQRHANLQRPPGEIQFFDQQTAEYEKRLHRSEAELVQFTRARGVASAALERDIALQKLGEADAAYRQIDQDRVETERRIASLGEQLKSFPSRSVTLKRWADNPEALEKMKTHLLELLLKRTELLSRFEPTYRPVQEVEQEIAETRAQIAAEALTPVRDETTDKDPNYEWARMEMEKGQVQWDGLRARQADAAAQVASLRQVAQQMQSDSVDQQDLILAAKADEDNYLLYLRKREEARIGDALDESRILNVAIVEPPVAPALPVHSMFLYLLLAFGLATAFSVGVGFATEYFDPTIRTPSEAHLLLGVPVLAWLPAPKVEVPRPSLFRIRGSKVVVQ
ncbi:MAG: GumC family protein [Terriglobales bacterium]